MALVNFFEVERALDSCIAMELAFPGEFTLSLPVLTGGINNMRIDYFLYVVGGPINDRRIYAPSRKLSVPPDYPESGTYLIDEFESGIQVPPEFPIGRSVPSMTWDEFQLKRQQYNSYLLSLFGSWSQLENGTQASDEKSAFRDVFDEIVETPLRPAYRHLNPGLFNWIWSA
ncbi:hypothetical protein [Roseibium album]|uniref:hypothetical protein n=1 Tax=Roseibium album TaxID=311410 RepID=UPI00248FBC92|nr:hypothetical protein [Roseibium album]